ncbi:radical SAM family heme chaperone HemW [Ruminococcus sp. 5_1_39BFAA]|uniref:radical SAM family heme chaperone HemW n=1 Tax=Ruminococcus sp. 5_1_39BFAA TaxID=457412 RepID=UPI00356592E1
MEEKNNFSPLELYVHIPFCVKKCAYCDFLSAPGTKELQREYVQALLEEIRADREEKSRPVTSVFIGGGTPSILDGQLMGRILEELRSNFAMLPDAEVTIEANPGTLSAEKLDTYRKSGVNRLSLGLQSPQDEELAVLGRIHSYDAFLESYYMSREAGFSNVNVDLMFAIPEQTRDGWQENLRKVAALEPEHISAYSLIVEEGTPFAERKLNLPDEDTEYAMYEDTAEILGQYGFRQYEISNYARKGFACRHNIGYWRRRDYLGFGLGAASFCGGMRYSNTDDLGYYLKNSGDFHKLQCNVEMLTEKDAMAEFMFLGLRMTDGISRAEFENSFGIPIEMIYGTILEKYKKLGLLEEQNGRICLTRRGIHMSNHVMADFLI